MGHANIGYFCDDENKKAYPGNGQPDVGKLCLLDVRTQVGQRPVRCPGRFDPRPGRALRRREGAVLLSPGGHGLLPSATRSTSTASGLRRLTSGPYDDYEPTYLPDGGIVFVSTRCQCWVNCWMTQVGVLYRCDADGGNIRRLSHNAEHDNTPAVLPDGRILYTRWEYVDRSQVEFHHLWTINPDGSGEMIYYGNMHPGIVMIDAKPIPNSRNVLVNFSPGPRRDRPPRPRDHRVTGRRTGQSAHRTATDQRLAAVQRPVSVVRGLLHRGPARTRCW